MFSSIKTGAVILGASFSLLHAIPTPLTRPYITADDSPCLPRHRRRQNQNPQAKVASAVNPLMRERVPDFKYRFCRPCHSCLKTRLSQHTFLALLWLFRIMLSVCFLAMLSCTLLTYTMKLALLLSCIVIIIICRLCCT